MGRAPQSAKRRPLRDAATARAAETAEASGAVGSSSGYDTSATAAPQTGATSSGVNIPTRTTIPDEILRHNISNEELGTLISQRKDSLRDTLRDVLLAALGAVLGSLPGFVRCLDEVFRATNPEPMTYARLAEIVVPVGAIAVSVLAAILLVAIKSKDPAAELAEAIRQRTRSIAG